MKNYGVFAWSGNRMEKAVPVPRLLFTSMLLPWASTSSRRRRAEETPRSAIKTNRHTNFLWSLFKSCSGLEEGATVTAGADADGFYQSRACCTTVYRRSHQKGQQNY